MQSSPRDPRQLSPAAMAIALGGLCLVGPALTVERGLAGALAAIAAAAVLGRYRGMRALAPEGAALERLPEGLRRTGAAAILLASGVLAILAGRGIADLVIAFPAAFWTLGLGIVAALVIPFVGRRTGGLLLAAAVLLGPLASAVGDRFEAGAEDGRGQAYSGPILGIHPFQALAIVIDGYGPFDVPINDFVEPDGSRGYGPQEYAEALERALHRIAELHFADGPARAREAFAGAEVRAFESPALLERLDRPVADGPQPRVQILSGSRGQRSRVELVCPGTRSDPRGLQADDVMARMCPDRHAAEGSAGLGLTGRWTGYLELRGNERLSLARLLGWTRSDDAAGRAVIRREEQLIGVGLVALALLILGGGGRRRQAGARALATWGAASLGLAGIVAFFFVVAAGPWPVVGALETPPAGAPGWVLAGWLPAILVAAGIDEVVGLGEGRRALAGRGWLVVALLVGTLSAAAWTTVGPWIRPELWFHEGPGLGAGAFRLPLEAWVIEVGARLGGALDLGPELAEAIVAGVLVAGLGGLLAGLASGLLGGVRALAPALGRWAPWVPLGVAASLAISRQTHGGALLLGPALGLLATVAGLLALARSEGRGRLLWGIVLLLSAAIVLWGVVDAWRWTLRAGPFLTLCSALAALLGGVLAGWGLLARRRSGP
ncbi:MAG: hypothetical protein H6710_04500 [Myxococcales bacterium]|nr:hypothetical protein [Myxococcales bacterium]